METLTINNKRYVVIEQKEFEKIQLKAAQKTPVVKNSRLVSEENMRLNSLTNGQKKITILESEATSIAEIAWFIESKGLPETAKHFVNNTFDFFEKLSNERIVHKACTYKKWKILKYCSVPFKKKYVVAYLN